ncbi:LysR substrate-binding domain-containing protein [Noviherbaspirillum massiliense]|uniref:LysR substrate-binding domain-containing protein n=1 Tax=Noviherbaspirillum massiliense TaxID=1465823 RepID=UPI00031AE67C|nr:LysR substrate-binding domain-containing protein [Noviherbaspirillum massiliense]
MRKINFDLDAMRTFSAGVELGSFAKAADRLGRSTSAVSAQLKKLEEQAGTAIVRKSGRGLMLTDAGELLLSYARRILELNDEACMALGGAGLEGRVRLGLQEDFGEQLLSEMLGRFARTHPSVRIEARVARNAELISQVQAAHLDLALAWNAGSGTPHMETIGTYALQWIGPADRSLLRWQEKREPIPLVAFDAPCVMRTFATEALDHAGIPWRLVFTSPSLGGVWAAVAAGLGVTVRSRFGMTASLRVMADGELGLPPLPSMELAIHRAESALTPACERLHVIIRESIRDQQDRFQ